MGTKSKLLEGRKIALCITGSVASVETPQLARELIRHGADVYVIMTKEAQKLIGPDLLGWATGNPVVTQLTGQTEHVNLAGDHAKHVDLILVAPSTANTISKIACGIDDTPVTTVVSTGFGSGIPIIIVPAMHSSLYNHPIVKENIEKLKKHGVKFVGPRLEEGKAKIAEQQEIVDTVIDTLTPKDLIGLNVLVTAGPTRAYLDPVRFITNPSSGKMGLEMAKEFAARGANVKLILGATDISVPSYLDVERVVSVDDMYNAVMSNLKKGKFDVFVSAAAISDFAPKSSASKKIKSDVELLQIELVPTPKIISEVKKKYPQIKVIGFKVETGVSDEELIERCRERINKYGIELMVGNDSLRTGAAFGYDTNEVVVVSKDKSFKLEIATKREVSKKIIEIFKSLFL